jgi:MFS family permease
VLCALAGLIALVRLLRIPIDQPEKPAGTISQRGLLDGFRVLWSIPALRVIALTGAVINTAWTAFAATFVLFAIEPGPMGLSPWAYGLLMTVSIAGGIAGSVIAPRWLDRFGSRSGVGMNIVANGITFAAPVLFLSPWLIGLVFLVSDAATPLWRVAATTLQQRAVPDDLRGRVAAAYRVISLGAATTGPAIGLAIASQIGARGLFAVVSLACFAMLIPYFARITEASMNP